MPRRLVSFTQERKSQRRKLLWVQMAHLWFESVEGEEHGMGGFLLACSSTAAVGVIHRTPAIQRCLALIPWRPCWQNFPTSLLPNCMRWVEAS